MLTIKTLEPTKETANLLESMRLKSYGIKNPSIEDYDPEYIDSIVNGTIIPFICYYNNKAAGGCYISDSLNSLYVEYIFILPEYQEKGLYLGRRLLEYILSNKEIVEEYYGKKLNQSKLYPTSLKSTNIYHKMGYSQSDETEILCKKLV